MHIKYQINSVFFRHTACPIELDKAGIIIVIFRYVSSVFVSHKVSVPKRYAYAVKAQILDIFKVTFGYIIILIAAEKLRGFFFAESAFKCFKGVKICPTVIHAVPDSYRFVKAYHGAHPGFLQKPAAEINAAKLYNAAAVGQIAVAVDPKHIKRRGDGDDFGLSGAGNKA